MEASLSSQNIFRRHIAIPQDHGSWVFLLSPLLIGIFAAGQWSAATLYLALAALAAFLIRQPVTVAIKVYSGRRPRRDVPAAWFWMAIYGLAGLLALAGLAAQGFFYLFYLALPGLPVFAWHLYLVSRRSERRQAGVEILGSGVLALAAPAALWVGLASYHPAGWWLFGLSWFQSAASIVYAYLRLEQRGLKETPPLAKRIQLGWRALLYASFNVLAVTALSIAGYLPVLLILPFALQWAETVRGALQPGIGVKPTSIGVRQLTVSALFTILFIIAWNI